MFGPKSYHSGYFDNSVFGLTTTPSKELVICSSVVVVVTFVQLVVGTIALVFMNVYSFTIIKQTFYNYIIAKKF